MKIKPKRFGFDLDNTLIDYSKTVQEYCRIMGLEDCKNIDSLRALLRASDSSGRLWQEAQGWLYTDGLLFAQVGLGAVGLCEYLKVREFELLIISHKTTHTPDFCGQKPLREIATEWLTSGELSSYFPHAESIYYEPTRELKIKRIQELNLDYFADDLEEVFLEPGFPKEIKSFLIQTQGQTIAWVKRVPSLASIQEIIEDEH